MNKQQIPATRNESWGFWGTMADNKNQAEAAWPLAITSIAKSTGETFEAVRTFLDSRDGRKFADEVICLTDTLPGLTLSEAIDMITEAMRSQKIDRATARYHDTPLDIDRLTALVIANALAENAI
ncbi:hypothetical protein ACJJJB_00270 (plasmid) [Microbulbifer sp. ANSA001]|uniref:hypothetical protein n=1 Tax=Microbulbifer sp. ANSA001 TaxID=3243358 RepID=UPI0040415A82